MELITDYEGDYQLTADVFTDVAIFSEIPSEAAPEAVEGGIEEQLVETDLFAFAPAEIVFEDVPPAGELTAFEQLAIDAMMAGDLSHFAPAFINDDGSWNYDLWSATNSLGNDLINNGIAPENFEAVATEWFST